jgi:hypothetical protein
VTLTQKKALVAGFLARCNAYADERVADYRQRLATAPDAERAALEAKIGEWTTYRRFNDYTLAELETATLDAWFAEPG